jgi:hypothetical protein
MPEISMLYMVNAEMRAKGEAEIGPGKIYW